MGARPTTPGGPRGLAHGDKPGVWHALPYPLGRVLAGQPSPRMLVKVTAT